MWPAGIGACSGTGSSGASNATPSSSSARVAGSLKESRAFACVIQTAPSTVARQIAPLRVAMIAPGRPRRPRSKCAPKRKKSTPSIVSSTPGWPSAARILRTMRAVPSEPQSIARSACFISGRRRPVTFGSA